MSECCEIASESKWEKQQKAVAAEVQKIAKGSKSTILKGIAAEKKMETKDILLAIELAKEDADKVAVQMAEKVLIPAERDFNLKKINYNGAKLDILEIASLLELDPYLLRYYFYLPIL